MSKKPPVHTLPYDGGWANKRGGSNRVSKKFGTKKEAQQAGRKTARREGTEHIISNKDGTLSERNSYHTDRYPTKR